MSKDNYHHDIISNLPESIKETILTCLPLRDAARTSVLSREWRYTWRKLPKIVLDDTVWGRLRADKGSLLLKFVRCIFNVVLNHEGPITKFKLSLPDLPACPEIDNLLLLLSRTDVEELELHMWWSVHYKLPSSFFRFQKLKHISLVSCSFRPPPGFSGFSHIHTIKMLRVEISSKQIESLLALCPTLEHLRLYHSSPKDESIDIYAPRLKSFKLYGVIKSFSFKNTPILAKIRLSCGNLYVGDDAYIEQRKFLFHELFSSLPMLTDLSLDYHFMKHLAADKVPTKPTLTAACLNTISLNNICLEDLHTMKCLLFLIRSSQNLQELNLYTYNSVGGIFWPNPAVKLVDAEEYSGVKLDKLSMVKLEYFTGTSDQMELVEFLLIKSPVLKKLILVNKDISIGRRNSMLEKVMVFRRSSASAEIVCKEEFRE